MGPVLQNRDALRRVRARFVLPSSTSLRTPMSGLAGLLPERTETASVLLVLLALTQGWTTEASVFQRPAVLAAAAACALAAILPRLAGDVSYAASALVAGVRALLVTPALGLVVLALVGASSAGLSLGVPLLAGGAILATGSSWGAEPAGEGRAPTYAAVYGHGLRYAAASLLVVHALGAVVAAAPPLHLAMSDVLSWLPTLTAIGQSVAEIYLAVILVLGEAGASGALGAYAVAWACGHVVAFLLPPDLVDWPSTLAAPQLAPGLHLTVLAVSAALAALPAARPAATPRSSTAWISAARGLLLTAAVVYVFDIAQHTVVTTRYAVELRSLAEALPALTYAAGSLLATVWANHWLNRAPLAGRLVVLCYLVLSVTFAPWGHASHGTLSVLTLVIDDGIPAVAALMLILPSSMRALGPLVPRDAEALGLRRPAEYAGAPEVIRDVPTWPSPEELFDDPLDNAHR